MIRRLISGALLIWVLGFIIFALTLPKAANEVRTDGVIVLTGGEGRITHGVAILADHDAKRLFISGVDRSVTLKQLALVYHIPGDLAACCIDLGHEADNTRANAQEAADWVQRMNFHSIRLVTNNWHMTRARFELSQTLPSDVSIVSDAVEVPPSIGILLEEYNKYMWRRMVIFAKLHFHSTSSV